MRGLLQVLLTTKYLETDAAEADFMLMKEGDEGTLDSFFSLSRNKVGRGRNFHIVQISHLPFLLLDFRLQIVARN
jgi:hypothetical protein